MSELTDEQFTKYMNLIEANWGGCGECMSCGWHGALHEHDIEAWEIQWALDHNGRLELNCVSKNEDSSDHRGVRIDLLALEKATSTEGKQGE